MTRRHLLGCAIAATLAAAPLRSFPQQPARRRFVIAWLSSGTPASAAPSRRAFDDALRALGYVEGVNVVIEQRLTSGNPDLLPAMADELVALRPDVIVTGSNRDTAAARRATATIPIVMSASVNPAAEGLVASLGRPGGNVTGLSLNASAAIYGKRLELLKEIVPNLRRVAVLRVRAEISAELIADFEQSAKLQGVALSFVDIKGRDELDRGLNALLALRPDAMFLAGTSLITANRQAICDFALEHRLPSSYGIKELPQAGCLVSYGVDNASLYQRAAAYVDKILKGARPAELPVEQPTKLELVLNLRTAKVLGLKIPPSVLIRADEVIE
jgi:putative ABC transport system substrate-binding protein